MAQSQYGQISDLQTLSITAAAGARFGNTAMTAALQAASSLADSYLVSQFTLPLAASPQGWDMSLTLHVCNVAAYLLYNQFGYNPGAPADAMVVTRYQSAIGWFEQVRDKKIFPQFVDSSGSSDGTPNEGAFIISDDPVGFTSRGISGACSTSFDPWGWDD